MTTITSQKRDLVTAEEGADMVGVQVWTFKRLAKKHKRLLPKIDLGHKTKRFSRADVQRYIDFKQGKLKDESGQVRDVIGSLKPRKKV